MTLMKQLGIALTTFNSERTIRRVLGALQPLDPEMVTVDSGSTDATLEICREFGCRILQKPWDGPVAQKQYAINQLATPWILLVDSDEIMDQSLVESIRRVITSPNPECDAWSLSRSMHFAGRTLSHAFCHEWRLRLFRRGTGQVIGMGKDQKGGHDQIEVAGSVGRLDGICIHDSWSSVPEVFRSYIKYGTRHADFVGTGGGLVNILGNPVVTFTKLYFLKQGFRDGWRGLVLCLGAMFGTAFKHILVYTDKKMEREKLNSSS
jgi:glycosyltransferase involved in cell wall biosynthesis